MSDPTDEIRSLLHAIDRKAGDQQTRRRIALLREHIEALIVENQDTDAINERLRRRLHLSELAQRVAAGRNERLRSELARRAIPKRASHRSIR